MNEYEGSSVDDFRLEESTNGVDINEAPICKKPIRRGLKSPDHKTLSPSMKRISPYKKLLK